MENELNAKTEKAYTCLQHIKAAATAALEMKDAAEGPRARISGCMLFLITAMPHVERLAEICNEFAKAEAE